MRNWIESRVRSNDRTVINVLANLDRMKKFEREMGNLRLHNEYRSTFGPAVTQAQAALNQPPWRSQAVGVQGSTKWSFKEGIRRGEKGYGKYNKIYRQILSGNKQVIDWVLTDQVGTQWIRDSILNEGGTQQEALDAVRFLRGEAERKVRRDPVVYAAGKDPQGSVVVSPARRGTARDAWHRELERLFVHRIRSGDIRYFGWFSASPKIQDLFAKRGMLNEYNAISSRLKGVEQQAIRAGMDAAERYSLSSPSFKHTFVGIEPDRSHVARFGQRNFDALVGVKNIGSCGDIRAFKSHAQEMAAVQRATGNYRRRFGGRDPGTIPLPFLEGKNSLKFAGKTLDWLFRHKPYYVAFLHEHYDSMKKVPEYKPFLPHLNMFLESIQVRNFLRDYFEDGGASAPMDMRPYAQQKRRRKSPFSGKSYYGYAWDLKGNAGNEYTGTPLTWRDKGGLRSGFGVSDAWRDDIFDYRRGRVTQKTWDEELGRYESLGAGVKGGPFRSPGGRYWVGGAVSHSLAPGHIAGPVEYGGFLISNYNLRKKEQRYPKLWDPDYYESLERYEDMQVMRNYPKGLHWQARKYYHAMMGPWYDFHKRLRLATEVEAGRFLDAESFRAKQEASGSYQRRQKRRGTWWDEERLQEKIYRNIDDPEQTASYARKTREGFRGPSGFYEADEDGTNYAVEIGKADTRRRLMELDKEIGSRYGWEVVDMVNPDLRQLMADRFNSPEILKGSVR